MIGAASTGASFRALGTYLVGDEGRVGWVETRNTLASDPHAVVAEMERDVALSRSRVEKPVYHLALSFDPTDAPTRDELRGAIDRTLRDLGLGDHPALVVAHTDTDHPHVHAMVSRVGADGKAWSTSFSNRRLRASVEAQERELGVRWTGRNADLARTPAAEREPGFAARVRSLSLADLQQTTSWRDLDARLAVHGLRVERRGRGAVVTDGTREAKLSSVSRSVSRPKLEARLGPLRAHEQGREVPAPRPPEKTSASRSLASSRRQPGKALRPSRSALRVGKGVVRSIDLDGGQSGDERLAGAPKTVASRAMRRAGRRAAKRVVSETAKTLTQRTLARRAAHRDLRPGGRIDRLVALVAERVRLGRLTHQRAAVLGVGTREKERAVAEVAGLRDRSERAGQAFTQALGSVYRDPAAAAHAFAQSSVREGVQAATQRLSSSPESFGQLRTSKPRGLAGVLRSSSDDAARAAAPAASRAGAAYLQSNAAYVAGSGPSGAPTGQASDLATAVARRESRIRTRLSGKPGRGTMGRLDARIARAFRQVGSVPGSRSNTTLGPLPNSKVKPIAKTRQAARVGRATSVRLGTVGLGVAATAARSLVRGLGR
ncbi:relaxase/mobilization nuclease domain-containing protein [Rubrivirga litoralis]|uniref:Relaxase/mobilization nuclease domain-containing protein n=1 Tax=Rubrivirga litoralis TaxID=3075598 RepID=A0ABU3BRR0_9BACT|nr:relaxase/mobilization nuclease domain-containing protein [Rubrivirga sp. F394]MDT0631979.1 relaxase/mobilization nuclease domain-containing protein [Rubrivirga sp. F394]